MDKTPVLGPTTDHCVEKSQDLSTHDIMGVAVQLADENKTLPVTELDNMATVMGAARSPVVSAEIYELIDTVIEGQSVGSSPGKVVHTGTGSSPAQASPLPLSSPSFSRDAGTRTPVLAKTPIAAGSPTSQTRISPQVLYNIARNSPRASPGRHLRTPNSPSGYASPPGDQAVSHSVIDLDKMKSPVFEHDSLHLGDLTGAPDGFSHQSACDAAAYSEDYLTEGEVSKAQVSLTYLSTSQVTDHTSQAQSRVEVSLTGSLGEPKGEEDFSLRYARKKLHISPEAYQQLRQAAASIPDLRRVYYLNKPPADDLLKSCRYCFDPRRCAILRRFHGDGCLSSPGRGSVERGVVEASTDGCSHCTARVRFELCCLDALARVYTKGLSLFTPIDSEIFVLLDDSDQGGSAPASRDSDDGSSAASGLEHSLQENLGSTLLVHGVPDESFVDKCVEAMAESEGAYKEYVKKALTRTKTTLPGASPRSSGSGSVDLTMSITRPRLYNVLAEVVCEGIFGLPGLLAFTLFPLIRSEYRHLHPAYTANVSQFPKPEAMREQIMLDASPENNVYAQMTSLANADSDVYSVTIDQIRAFYFDHVAARNTSARLFNSVKLAAASRIVQSDLLVVLASVCRYHPALVFLRATPEFQVSYSSTVVARVFYSLDRTFKDSLALSDIAKDPCPLVNTLWQLQREPDINRVLRYFSYEHFYVIFCKFWELDTDHDQLLSAEDLCRYGASTCPYQHMCRCDRFSKSCPCGNVYNQLAVERVFQGVPRPLHCKTPGRIDYADFIPFILSEEDKDSDVSIDYFFAIMDANGDGFIDETDMRYFWQEMLLLNRCHLRENDRLPDLICQMTDMCKHTQHCTGEGFVHGDERITKRDIRRSKTPGNIFNVFFNFTKSVCFECKDPYTIKYSPLMFEKTAWDRYSRVTYDALESRDSAVAESDLELCDDDFIQDMDAADEKQFNALGDTAFSRDGADGQDDLALDTEAISMD